MTDEQKRHRRGLSKRVREAQAYFASIVLPEVCLSDELLKDRREEAAREEQEERGWSKFLGAVCAPAKPLRDD